MAGGNSTRGEVAGSFCVTRLAEPVFPLSFGKAQRPHQKRFSGQCTVSEEGARPHHHALGRLSGSLPFPRGGSEGKSLTCGTAQGRHGLWQGFLL